MTHHFVGVHVRAHGHNAFHCLPDPEIGFEVDEQRRTVTIGATHFDCQLQADVVARRLPQQHGIVASRDDYAGMPAPRATYRLRVRFGSHEFDGTVVRLSADVGAQLVAVRLDAAEAAL